MKIDHKHIATREPKGKVRKCSIPGCPWVGRGLTEHLATEHHVPLVRLGQGDFTRDWPKGADR